MQHRILISVLCFVALILLTLTAQASCPTLKIGRYFYHTVKTSYGLRILAEKDVSKEQLDYLKNLSKAILSHDLHGRKLAVQALNNNDITLVIFNDANRQAEVLQAWQDRKLAGFNDCHLYYLTKDIIPSTAKRSSGTAQVITLPKKEAQPSFWPFGKKNTGESDSKNNTKPDSTDTDVPNQNLAGIAKPATASDRTATIRTVLNILYTQGFMPGYPVLRPQAQLYMDAAVKNQIYLPNQSTSTDDQALDYVMQGVNAYYGLNTIPPAASPATQQQLSTPVKPCHIEGCAPVPEPIAEQLQIQDPPEITEKLSLAPQTEPQTPHTDADADYSKPAATYKPIDRDALRKQDPQLFAMLDQLFPPLLP